MLVHGLVITYIPEGTSRQGPTKKHEEFKVVVFAREFVTGKVALARRPASYCRVVGSSTSIAGGI